MKKILLICSLSQNIFNFRIPLIQKLKNRGFEVVTAGFDEEYKEDLNQIGIEYHSVGGYYKSSNLFDIILLKNKYKSMIKKINPNIIFTFMPKPNTFGVLAAHKLRIENIFSMVEGAGDAFGNTTIRWRIIKKIECLFYKKSFKYAKKVFFLNNDDLQEFINLRLLKKEKSFLIHGIGVDLNKFIEVPVNKKSNTFLMISRLLETKGVFDYIMCAKLVKEKYPEAIFNYLGNEGTIKVKDLEEPIKKGYINYLGSVKDVRDALKDCLAFILPSFYREGLPMSIMEAEAIGRCIITTNNVGCKDTVINGKNGFIVEKKDCFSLAEKCIYLLENKEKAFVMGHNSRIFAEKHFDEKKINEMIILQLEENICIK